MQKYQIGHTVQFIEGKFKGIIGSIHMADDGGNLQVRIIKWQEWAGQIISALSEDIEEYKFPPIKVDETSGEVNVPLVDVSDEETPFEMISRYISSIPHLWLIVGVVLMVGAIAYSYFYRQEPIKEKTFLEVKTEEIQSIEYTNLSEFQIQKKAVEVFNNSKERVRKNDDSINRLRSDVYFFIGTVPWQK